MDRNLRYLALSSDGVFVAHRLDVETVSGGRPEDAAMANLREAVELDLGTSDFLS
jgi:hypothetical protein